MKKEIFDELDKIEKESNEFFSFLESKGINEEAAKKIANKYAHVTREVKLQNYSIDIFLSDMKSTLKWVVWACSAFSIIMLINFLLKIKG